MQISVYGWCHSDSCAHFCPPRLSDNSLPCDDFQPCGDFQLSSLSALNFHQLCRANGSVQL